MKSATKINNNKKGLECLNCGQPLRGDDNFCSACGQKNNGKALNFSFFVKETIANLFSYDSRLWRSVLTILRSPAKLSQEYIAGKRSQYVNPFRFYLVVLFVFLLVINLTNKIEAYKSLRISQVEGAKNISQVSFINIDDISVNGEKIKNEKDMLKAVNTTHIDSIPTMLGKLTYSLTIFTLFSKKHQDLPTNVALDSLSTQGFKKNKWNAFLYERAKEIGKQGKSGMVQKAFSNYPIFSLFIIPILALLFKLFHSWKKHSYMKHLVFVFHEQTMFFILLSLFYLLASFIPDPNAKNFNMIPIFGFVIYDFIAYKRYYNYKWLLASFKYVLLNLFVVGLIISITIIFTLFVVLVF